MKKTLEQQFNEFDTLHPQIYSEFSRRAHLLIAAGRTHYGAKTIMEAMRYHAAVSGKPDDAFKMNNNWPAFYSRKWLKDNPDYPTFFETRTQKAVLPAITDLLQNAIGA